MTKEMNNMNNSEKVFSVDDLLGEKLVMMDVQGDNVEEVMKQVCDYAQELGFVKESYLQAVLEREAIYPTGLPTEVMKVALPHTTDRSHVLESGIFIAKLANPVAFKEMGDGERDVLVEMLFMLAVNGDKEQLTVLQDIVGMFTKNGALQALKEADNPRAVIAAVKNHL